MLPPVPAKLPSPPAAAALPFPVLRLPCSTCASSPATTSRHERTGEGAFGFHCQTSCTPVESLIAPDTGLREVRAHRIRRTAPPSLVPFKAETALHASLREKN